MPPSKAQFEKRFGDTILGDFDEDEDDNEKQANKDESEPPKPTADVMMSRNLKGGAAKNFNFAFSSGEDESQDSQNKED